MTIEKHPHGPDDTCLWCGGDFYGTKKPLFKRGQRVRVRRDCRFGGRLSIRAGQIGRIVKVDPMTTKSRYLIRFPDSGTMMDWWADRDLLPVRSRRKK